MAPRKARSMTSATRYPTPYGVINLPHVPDRKAMQNLEGQLAKVIGAEAAMTFAALPVQPERVRVQLDAGLYSYERIHSDERLMMIEVPSGFTAAVLPDGGNGRTAHDRVMAVGTVPPWPLPQATESAEAVLRMAGFDPGEGKPLTALERAVEAVEASAKEIITGRVKLRRELAAVGVLRDIDVQATRICLLDGDGHTAGIRHVAQAAEGSSRIALAASLSGRQPSAPLNLQPTGGKEEPDRLAAVRNYLLAERERIAKRLMTTPEDQVNVIKARLFTAPMRLVIGVVDNEGDPVDPERMQLHEATRMYVSTIHEGVKSWDGSHQAADAGERLTDRLHKAGVLDEETRNTLVGRSDILGTDVPPDVAAARLLTVLTTLRYNKQVRAALLGDLSEQEAWRDSGLQKRTVVREDLPVSARSIAAGPLLERAFRHLPATHAVDASPAFGKPWLPREVWGKIKSCDELDLGDPQKLLARAVEALHAADAERRTTSSTTLSERGVTYADEHGETPQWIDGRPLSPEAVELIFRGGPLLLATGLILSDQGSQGLLTAKQGRENQRGNPDRVLLRAARTVQGLELLAKAAAAARERGFIERPAEPGDNTDIPERYSSEKGQANQKIRQLLFPSPKTWTPKRDEDSGNAPSERNGTEGTNPEDPARRCARLAEEGFDAIKRAESSLNEAKDVHDGDGLPVLVSQCLPHADAMAAFEALGRIGKVLLEYKAAEPVTRRRIAGEAMEEDAYGEISED